MENENFTTTIEVPQSADTVFNCLTHVSKWWSKDFEGTSTKLNDEFIICHAGKHYSKQQLVEVEPGKRLVWLVTDSELNWLAVDKHEWTNTKMIFTLSSRGSNTVLHFTHQGLVPGKECYTACQRGWTMIVTNWLFNYITNGKSI